jgi:microcin C transport system substrate-binding protein
MTTRRNVLLAGLAGVLARPAILRADAPAPTRTYAMSLLGKPALPEDFPYFPYVDPKAPKGGDVALSSVGTFDSFNQFIVQGTPATDLARLYDTLLVSSADEAGTSYGHLAKTVEVPADRSWVAFELRPEAKFNDGHPVTAEDVVFTFNALREKGRPFYRQYYADVKEVTAEGPLRVVFHFSTNGNRELPMILGEMVVVPKHWWATRDISKPLTEPPLGSGPYRIGAFEFGRTVTFERVANWWAAGMPTGIGRFNFATLRSEYFRDATVALEAFKAGSIDFRQENISKQWATAYDFPAVQQGLVKKEEIRHHLPTGMQGFAMNTRRAIFKDVRVRKALAWAYDFEWANKNLFYSAYTRTESYFSNSDLASSGLPEGAELALLEKYRDKLPPEIFKEPFRLPVTDGSGNDRKELKVALAMLQDAGWTVKDLKLVDPQGNQMSFEIVLDDAAFERVALPYVQNLTRLGIDVRVRTVDPSQYQQRMDNYDYDMTVVVFGESDSPGNEQVGYWTCASGKQVGGDNQMGVCDPVVDALVEQLISAPDRDRLITVTRALDRVLLSGWYLVPQWHSQFFRVAYWNRFARPDKPIRAGLDFNTWWLDQKLAAVTDPARSHGP